MAGSETVARCGTLGRSHDVCTGSRFTAKGKRCEISGESLCKRLEVNAEEEGWGVHRQMNGEVLSWDM